MKILVSTPWNLKFSIHLYINTNSVWLTFPANRQLRYSPDSVLHITRFNNDHPTAFGPGVALYVNLAEFSTRNKRTRILATTEVLGSANNWLALELMP